MNQTYKSNNDEHWVVLTNDDIEIISVDSHAPNDGQPAFVPSNRQIRDTC